MNERDYLNERAMRLRSVHGHIKAELGAIKRRLRRLGKQEQELLALEYTKPSAAQIQTESAMRSVLAAGGAHDPISDATPPAPVAPVRAVRGSRKAAAASNTEAVLAAVTETPRTVGEIAKACGLSTIECAAVLKPARAAGKILGREEKRGMRYSVGA